MNVIASSTGVTGEPRDSMALRAELLDRALLAHDVRGGLMRILGGLAALDAEEMSREVREQLERISATTEAVACLVSRVFTDPSASVEAEFDFHSTDVPRLLDYLRRRWKAEARDKGLSLRVVAEADVPTRISIDPVALARILSNLIGNSVKHCPSGGIEIVASGTSNGGILFRLCDTGPGIREEALERVLYGPVPELLVPAQPTDGLSIRVLRLLAEEISADLTLRNREGGGLEAQVSISATHCTHTEPAPAYPDSDLAGVRILLAEDNPTNQMVATQMLRALRAEVTVTSDGAEALAAFEEGSFDMVVLDIEMPRVSGLDVIRRIRARKDARASVPIVALTAYAMREHQDRIAKAGADGLISKPISGIEPLGRALALYLPANHRAGTGEAEANAPTGPASPVLDAEVYDALAQAIGPELMSELIEKVVADIGAARADIEAGQAANDAPAIRAASHILISVAGAIGAVGLQSLAQGLNGLASEGASLDAAVGACLAEIDAVLSWLAKSV